MAVWMTTEDTYQHLDRDSLLLIDHYLNSMQVSDFDLVSIDIDLFVRKYTLMDMWIHRCDRHIRMRNYRIDLSEYIE